MVWFKHISWLGLAVALARCANPFGSSWVDSEFHPGLPRLTVEPMYFIAPNWNDYVSATNTNTGCNAGSDTACIHGGDKRRVVTFAETCAGASMTDALEAFDWSCDDSSGRAVFTSTLKPTKGLRHLLNSDSWKENSVHLAITGVTYSSFSQVWWENQVRDYDSLDSEPSEGEIITFSGTSERPGFAIGADKIAVVGLPGAVWNRRDDADDDTTFAMSGANYAWVEGNFNALNHSNYVAMILATRFSRFHQSGFTNATNGVLLASVSYSHFDQVSISNVTSGIYDLSFSNNTFTKLVISNTSMAIGLSDAGSIGNVFGEVVLANNTFGFVATGGRNNHVHALTITNTGSNADGGAILIDDSNKNAITHYASIGNESGVAVAGTSEDTTLAQLALSHTDVGLVLLDSASNPKVLGNLLLDTRTTPGCIVGVGVTGENINTGGVGSNCTPGTGLTVPVTTLELSSSFVAATSDAINSSANANGQTAFSTALDWFGFENFFRFWGKGGTTFPSEALRLACGTSDTCQLYDMRLRASDTKILNRTGNGTSANSSFVGDSACPTEASGDEIITTPTGYTALKNALAVSVEGQNIRYTGWCVSGSTCLYTPNFGAYQGHGEIASCQFQDGSVTGVTMYGYSQNGI